MAKTVIEVREEWSEWLSSATYDSAEVEVRFAAFAADPSWESARPLQRVGAALRVESRERAREVIDRIVGQLRWERIWQAQEHTWAFFCWALAPFAQQEHELGYGAPLRLPMQLFHLIRHADRHDAQTAQAAVAYLEYGDEAAEATLRARLAGAKPWDLRCSLTLDDAPSEIADRYYALLAERLGDTADELRFLARHGTGFSGLRPTAARAIARRHELGPISPGANCELGYGRSSDDDARPLLEVAWRLDRALFHEILPLVLDALDREDHALELLAFLPWDDEQEIWNEVQSFGCRRLGPLVCSWSGKHGQRGAASAKLHQSESKATADFRAKLAGKEKALGVAPAAPTLHDADPEQALYQAARRGRRCDVRRLLRHGVAPDAFRDDEGLSALHAACTDDPEIVRWLIEAGAAAAARTADGATPLLRICDGEHHKPHALECARYLIAAGATDGRRAGLTALHHAARAGQAELVELLLQAGLGAAARVDADAAPEFAGKTALELARAGEHHATVRILELRCPAISGACS